MSYRCGYVGLVGLPNSGKSSLLNNILDEDLSIVSPKPQTTRRSFVGIYSDDQSQIIFLDAPGFVDGKSGMFDFLRAEFFRTLDNVDELLVILANDQKESQAFMRMWGVLQKSNKPMTLVVTKSDQPRSEFTDEFVQNEWGKDRALFEINNLKPSEPLMKSLVHALTENLPEQSGFFYERDQLSTWQMRELVADWIREACFNELEMEIPFGLGVRVNTYSEEPKIIKIDATIMVEKENHKGIVIGRKGGMLRQIGQQAREKIERILGQKVFLQTHVSTKKNWQKNKQIMKELGYGDAKS